MLLPMAKWSHFHENENEKIDFDPEWLGIFNCLYSEVTKKFIHGLARARSIRALLFIILTLYGDQR